MKIQIDESVIGVALSDIRESISQKLVKTNKSQRDQAMAVDALGFLALQILIPMLVSLCSSALYDVLKGRVVAKLHRKELEGVATEICGKTGDTRAPLSVECMETLSAQLAPLGFTNSEIARMYEGLTAVVEQHPRNSTSDQKHSEGDRSTEK
jgi:hypothetical protein